MKRILSEIQITEARGLHQQGKTKRWLAHHYQVSPTTIWENVFCTIKRVRISKQRERDFENLKDIRPKCAICEIRLTRDVRTHHNSPVSIFQVPANFKMGDRCLGCYLKSKGMTHMDLINS